MSMRQGRIVHTARHRGQRPFVEDNIDILDHRSGHLIEPHVSLDELDLVHDAVEVASLTREQVVHDAHETPLGHQPLADIGANESGPTGHQELLHPYRPLHNHRTMHKKLDTTACFEKWKPLAATLVEDRAAVSPVNVRPPIAA